MSFFSFPQFHRWAFQCVVRKQVSFLTGSRSRRSRQFFRKGKLAIAEDDQHHSPGSDPADFPGPFTAGTYLSFHVFPVSDCLLVLVRFLYLPPARKKFSFFSRMRSSLGDSVLGSCLFPYADLLGVELSRSFVCIILYGEVKRGWRRKKQTHSVPKPSER